MNCCYLVKSLKDEQCLAVFQQPHLVYNYLHYPLGFSLTPEFSDFIGKQTTRNVKDAIGGLMKNTKNKDYADGV